MRRMAFGALLAGMLVSGSTFGAGAAEHRGMLSWQTGDGLLDMCLHEQGTEQLAFCIGYVVAVAEVTAYDQDACISNAQRIHLGAVGGDLMRQFRQRDIVSGIKRPGARLLPA